MTPRVSFWSRLCACWPFAITRSEQTLVEQKRQAWGGEPIRYQQTQRAQAWRLRLVGRTKVIGFKRSA